MVYMGARNILSMLAGLILLILGGIPLLNKFGVISFGLPGFLSGLVASIFVWIIAVAAVYLVIDGFIVPHGHPFLHWFLIIIGLVFLVIGLIPILYKEEVIKFTISFLENLIVYNFIITIEGLLLIIAGFKEH